MSRAPEGEVEEIVWSPRLGAHLEASRQHANLRRVDLANQMGVSEETIRLWEKGVVQPSVQRLARLISLVALEAADWPLRSGPPPELSPLAVRLWSERDGRGITQAAAAKLLGVPPTTYAGWETGRTTPSDALFGPLAGFLGTTEDAVAGLCTAPFVVDTSGWPPLGQLVGARRQALRLNRAQLAEMVGVASGSVAAWEVGTRAPSAKLLPHLADALSVDIALLSAALPQGLVTTAFGRLIRTRQRELGLLSSDVAHLVGTTEATVSRWVHGKSQPTPRNLRRLAAALRMPHARVLEAIGGGT